MGKGTLMSARAEEHGSAPRSAEGGEVGSLGEQQRALLWSLLSQAGARALPTACWCLTFSKLCPLSKPQFPRL